MGMRSQAVEEGVLPSVPRWTTFCIVKVRMSLWREVSGCLPLVLGLGLPPFNLYLKSSDQTRAEDSAIHTSGDSALPLQFLRTFQVLPNDCLGRVGYQPDVKL